MRIVALALALVAFAGSAHALSAEQAAARIETAILRSTKVADKTSAFTKTLEHMKKGQTRLRFRAQSKSGLVVGEIDLATEKVTITGYSAAIDPSSRPANAPTGRSQVR